MSLQPLVWMAVVVSIAGAELSADQRPNQSDQTPEQISVVIQQPPKLAIPTWFEPAPKRLGILTLTKPEWPGGIVQLSVPVGELAMRAARAIGQAQHRRAEQRARREVEQALKDFQASQR
jgi:hypothetical protein